MNQNRRIPRDDEAMTETLRKQFMPHLGLPRARLTCFMMMVLALIGQRNVSLVWLSTHPHTAAKPEVVNRRLKRFFASCVLPAKRPGGCSTVKIREA